MRPTPPPFLCTCGTGSAADPALTLEPYFSVVSQAAEHTGDGFEVMDAEMRAVAVCPNEAFADLVAAALDGLGCLVHPGSDAAAGSPPPEARAAPLPSSSAPITTDRVVIAGGPRTGKTTAAEELAGRTGSPVRHTDDVRGLKWGDDSAEVSTWLDAPGPWIVEGVAAGRALRKWFAAHPMGTPADRVLWCPKPLVPRTPGQETMAKGCETVFRELLPLLRARGVEVLPLPAPALPPTT